MSALSTHDTRSLRGSGSAGVFSGMKPILRSLALAALLVPALRGQVAMTFEAASIKPNTSGNLTGAQIGLEPGGRWVMTNMPAISLIYSAYPTLTHEVDGVPAWVTADRYDVNAKASAPPTATQLQSMLQALLADRFAFHGRIETLDRPVYTLVVARADGRLGHYIRRFDGDCAAHGEAVPHGAASPSLPAPTNGATPCGMLFGGDQILAGGIPMAMLAANISQAAGRVVVDRTKLPGVYEFTLRYSMRPGPATGPEDAPSIFVALEEQLGLKLEPGRASLERVVVDHIERPTAD
jgi:bla regulator protein BlaR1